MCLSSVFDAVLVLLWKMKSDSRREAVIDSVFQQTMRPLFKPHRRPSGYWVSGYQSPPCDK